MSRFVSVFKLAEICQHSDPTLLSIVDSADVSLYFLSKLDESRRWICTFQSASLFVYATSARCRYRFAILNRNINYIPSIDRVINNDIVREDVSNKLKISAENIQHTGFFSYESEKADQTDRGMAFAKKTDCQRIYSLILRLKYIVSPGPILSFPNRHENRTSREDHEMRAVREHCEKKEKSQNAFRESRYSKDKETTKKKQLRPSSPVHRKPSPQRKQKENRSGNYPLHKLVSTGAKSRINSKETIQSDSESEPEPQVKIEQKSNCEKSEPKNDDSARIQFANLLQKLNSGVDKRRKMNEKTKNPDQKDSGIEVSSSSPTSSSRSSLSSNKDSFDRNPSSRSQKSPETLFPSDRKPPIIDIESLPIPSIDENNNIGRPCTSCRSKNNSPSDLLLRGPLEHDVIPEVDESSLTSSDDGSEIFNSIFSQSELKFTTDISLREKIRKVFSTESDGSSDESVKSDLLEDERIYKFSGSKSMEDLSLRSSESQEADGSMSCDDSADKEVAIPSYSEFLRILGDSLKTEEFYRKFRNEFLINSLETGRRLYL